MKRETLLKSNPLYHLTDAGIRTLCNGIMPWKHWDTVNPAIVYDILFMYVNRTTKVVRPMELFGEGFNMHPSVVLSRLEGGDAVSYQAKGFKNKELEYKHMYNGVLQLFRDTVCVKFLKQASSVRKGLEVCRYFEDDRAAYRAVCGIVFAITHYKTNMREKFYEKMVEVGFLKEGLL